MKRVLLIVIDALATRVVMPALRRRQLPTLAALADRGVARANCIASFPSITPTATASIITGVYPVDHHIASAFWYEEATGHVDYYGDDFWVAVGKGVDEFFNDFLVRLNEDRLHAETLYQRIERHGLSTAAVNFMWFRGETAHDVNAPLLLKLFPGVTFPPRVRGPEVLALADFAASKLPGSDEPLQASGGVGRRFGFHDDTTADYLLHLSTADPFPELTVAYFPNNDFASHDLGPERALETLRSLDVHLSRFIEQMGGLDAFLEASAVIVTGDHAQCDLIRDQSGRDINLVETLGDYQLARAGHAWADGDELMLCPNMRSCQIYVRDRLPAVRDRVIERLLDDPRVDQVLWCRTPWEAERADEHTDPRREEFHVATAVHGRLRFSSAVPGAESTGRDVYGTHWRCDGHLECVDARVEDGHIIYGEYPNALERIATGFSPGANELWVTAKAGCEFSITETSIHRGGSHGALNKDDSIVPLIAAGLPQGVVVPDLPRTIDVAPLCLRILGLPEEADLLVHSRIAGNGAETDRNPPPAR